MTAVERQFHMHFLIPTQQRAKSFVTVSCSCSVSHRDRGIRNRLPSTILPHKVYRRPPDNISLKNTFFTQHASFLFYRFMNFGTLQRTSNYPPLTTLVQTWQDWAGFLFVLVVSLCNPWLGQGLLAPSMHIFPAN